MNRQDFELLQRYLNGNLPPSEMEALETLLRTDPDARRTLRSLATVDEKLRERAAASEIVPEAPPVPHPSWWNQAILVLGGMAAMLVFGLCFWNPGKPQRQVPPHQPLPEQGIARVIRMEGSGSVNGSVPLAGVSELHPGTDIVLEEGLVELAYRETGVHVIATAPLDVHLETDMHLMLKRGEVKLVVPPQGIGFVVETLERKITDLGTSFVVSAKETGSEVLVLDGQINVDGRDGSQGKLMVEGEIAAFGKEGQMKLRSKRPAQGIPELPIPDVGANRPFLKGKVLGFPLDYQYKRTFRAEDVIGQHVMPLVHSGFRDLSCLSVMKEGNPLRFNGILGTYNHFPNSAGLAPFASQYGWLAWYSGKVVAPEPGRYRFWGYADNHLMLSIDGKTVFEGSRYDSAFRQGLKVGRQNHPALPCLNAQAGFASGNWVELGEKPFQLDILFGETAGHLTSALLLVEKEGANYEKTFWGQPKWPLFLTEQPSPETRQQFESVLKSMEAKLMGSFSIPESGVWRVATDS